MRRRAFTLVELLTVIAMIALLMALLLPALRSASLASKTAKTGSNLRQLGNATLLYIQNWDNHLPQKAWDVGGGNQAIVGTLFGGKAGTLPFFGINEVGSARRPLNRYLTDQTGTLNEGTQHERDSEMLEFESPLDSGGPIPGFGAVPSFYDALGSSYTLNDHSLDGEGFATLVPTQSPNGRPGGRMPQILDTTKTWVIAEHPIYNYQENGDRGLDWYNGAVRASMWFLDGHVATSVPVPPGIHNTTSDYTFLPSPDWFGP